MAECRSCCFHRNMCRLREHLQAKKLQGTEKAPVGKISEHGGKTSKPSIWERRQTARPRTHVSISQRGPRFLVPSSSLREIGHTRRAPPIFFGIDSVVSFSPSRNCNCTAQNWEYLCVLSTAPFSTERGLKIADADLTLFSKLKRAANNVVQAVKILTAGKKWATADWEAQDSDVEGEDD